ncbi:MAG: rhamnulokinase [Burkholderiales bacterium]|nr:rhamnulokinase [Phycisphaerae bacterium]
MQRVYFAVYFTETDGRMKQQKYLAFDFGAESGRAILGSLADGRLTLEEKHRFANPMGQLNGRLQWNVLGQWEQIKQGLKATRGIKLDGIGVDTWGVDFGLLDSSGDLLGNPTMYRDPVTAGMMKDVFSIIPREEVFDTTGIQFMEINTLYQLRALVKANSAKLATARTMLFMPDLFNYFLTGVAKAEFSIVSTSQMYDPRKRAWATQMLTKLGIPTHILPEIIPTGTVLGPLLKSVADECEVDQATVIAPGGHDTASAVVSVPAEGQDWCYISSGTWSLMGVELPEPLINPKSLQYNYTNEGGIGGSIRFLKNIMGLWLVQECRRAFTKDGHDHTYAELTAMAGESKPYDVLIDPDHAPFASPGDMPKKIDAFCGLTSQKAPSTRGAYVRACLDSLACKYRQTLEGLQDLLGKKIGVIHIVGGGTQNELLNQLTADVCQRPVVAGPIEATAIGNIIVQAMATGAIKSLEEGRGVVRASFPVKRYEPRASPAVDLAYQRYLSYAGK